MPMSDVEQMQMVKSWVKEYGYYILFSIVFFLVANFGWRYWQQYKQSKIEHATLIYTQMLEANDEKKGEESKLFAEKLIKDYTTSVYATFAALVLAKNNVESDDLKSAQENLRFVIKNSPSKHLKELARVRLARVLIAMKEPQKALDLLSSEDGGVYGAYVNEVRGDALLKLGKNEEAKKAYHKAEEMSANESPKLPLLKMKVQQF